MVVSPHSFESGTGENPVIPRNGQDSHRVFGSERSSRVPEMARWEYKEGENSWIRELSSTKLNVPDIMIPFEAQIEHSVKVIKGEKPAS